MKLTSRELLFAAAAIAMATVLTSISIKLVKKDAELTALQGAAARSGFRHATAQIRIVSLADPARRATVHPLESAAKSGKISGNWVSRSVPPAADVQFSFVATHLCSTDDGDVYEIFWSEHGRLPPKPNSHNFPESSKIIKTGGGVVNVYESDKWKIEIVDGSEHWQGR